MLFAFIVADVLHVCICMQSIVTGLSNIDNLDFKLCTVSQIHVYGAISVHGSILLAFLLAPNTVVKEFMVVS